MSIAQPPLFLYVHDLQKSKQAQNELVALAHLLSQTPLFSHFIQHIVFIVDDLEFSERLMTPLGLRTMTVQRVPAEVQKRVEFSVLQQVVRDHIEKSTFAHSNSLSMLKVLSSMILSDDERVFLHDPYLLKASCCPELRTFLSSALSKNLRVDILVSEEEGGTEQEWTKWIEELGLGRAAGERISIRTYRNRVPREVLHARWICTERFCAMADRGFALRDSDKTLWYFPLPAEIRNQVLQVCRRIVKVDGAG